MKFIPNFVYYITLPGKQLFQKGMAYVAISRVKTLEGLAIIDMEVQKLITTDTFSPCDLAAIAELDRLRAKNAETRISQQSSFSQL